MKRFIVPIVIGIVPVFLLTGCKGHSELEEPQTITIEASFSDDYTRADLEQADGTRDLITRWKEDDLIRLYLIQDGKGYTLDPVKVYNISSDGKRCSFGFKLPSDISLDHSYDIYGLCDAKGVIQEQESLVIAKSQLKRMHWDDRKAPMWFHSKGGNSSIQASFRHLGTYEVLHVTNTSKLGVMFRHNGFDVEVPWYKSTENTPLKDDYDPTQSVQEPGDDAQSGSVYLGAGQTGKYLSWYIPTGATIKEATLLASVDGKDVSSVNTKTSSVRIQRGHVYHMYATWDGNELRFVNKNEPSSDMVDLGLPSGVLWASHNLGASSEVESGNFYAWGETEPKSNYSWNTYMFGTPNNITKYSESDNELTAEDDAATQTLGNLWRIPTKSEVEELVDNCDFEWVTRQGINGLAFTSKNNGRQIFLPASGLKEGTESINGNQRGYYWTANLQQSFTANYLLVYGEPWLYANERCNGYTIRPVYGPRGAAGTPALEVTPTSVNFGDVPVGSKKSVTVTIKNAGDAILKFNVWAPEAPFSAVGYEQYSSMQETLLPGESKDVIVSYEPTELTEDADWLRIDWNAGEGTHNVKLIGRGTDGIATPKIVDLGLSVKWASFNLGATKPEEYGDYFAWGEIEPKKSYTWDTYKWCMGTYNTLTKYCRNQDYGFEGFTDGKTILELEDDAAHVKLGGKWRLPTKEDENELIDSCTWEWISVNGVWGQKVTGPNGNSIFLPAAGYKGFYYSIEDDYLFDSGSKGAYWTSSHCLGDVPNVQNSAEHIWIDSSEISRGFKYRDYGLSIRPVYDDSESSNYILHDPSPADGETGVDPHVYLTCYGHLYDHGENIFEVRVSEKPDMSVLIPRTVRYTGPYVYAVDFELESNKTYYWQVAQFDFEKEAWVKVSPIWHFTTK